MKKFMDQDFLLSTDTAKWLYHEAAEHMPIIDYHCHINPQEIAEDRKFDNITQVWLGDHYRGRGSEGKVPGVCIRTAPADRESHVSLEPPGAAARIRDHGAFDGRERGRDL